MYVFISSLSTHHQERNKKYINGSKRIRKIQIHRYERKRRERE